MSNQEAKALLISLLKKYWPSGWQKTALENPDPYIFYVSCYGFDPDEQQTARIKHEMHEAGYLGLVAFNRKYA